METNGTELLSQLAAPFRPEQVSFKIQANPKGDDKEPMALVVAYVDARAVAARLNEVAGLGWSSATRPSATGLGVECTLTVLGAARTDVGTPSDTEGDKGAYSDALKRAAVQFGVGAYLYDFPKVKARVEKFGNSWYITREAQAEIVTLVKAIHQGVPQLPAFRHLKVTGYQPLFAQAVAPAAAPTNGNAKPRRMTPHQRQRLIEEFVRCHGAPSEETALGWLVDDTPDKFGTHFDALSDTQAGTWLKELAGYADHQPTPQADEQAAEVAA